MVLDPHAKTPLQSGQVLVASPSLLDMNFRESLVLLVEHSSDGSLGFVINRPLDVELAGVLGEAKIPDAVKDVPVYTGGPVEPERLILAYFCEHEEQRLFHCRLLQDLEEGESMVGTGDGWLCGYLGHAGWGEGQLEEELRAEAWNVALPHQAMFEPRFCRGIWSTVRNGDPRWKQVIPYLPEDPELN